MKTTSKRLGIYLLALLTLISVTVALRTVACFTELDFKSGYFDNKVCISIANWFAVGGCAVGFSYLFVEKRGLKFAAAFDNGATYISSGAVAVALLFLAASLTYGAVKKPGNFSALHVYTDLSSTLSLILSVLAIISIGTFLLYNLSAKKEHALRGAFCIVTVIFLALYATYLYFDTAAPLNSPAKIVDQMAYLFTSVFFIYETRISLGRELWTPYIAFGFISSLLTAYSSIPALIVYFAKGQVISDSIAESALTFALFLFITCRLSLILALPEDKKCPTVEAILLMEEERIRTVKEAENERLLARDTYINEENDTDTVAEDDAEGNYTINVDEIRMDTSDDAVGEDG